MDPIQNNPMGGQPQPSPVMPAAPSEPVSTPMPQQPLESQGMPTGQVPGEEMASPEQVMELKEMLKATEEKYSELQTAKFSSGNEKEVARVEALKEIFIMMQEAGVDLNDPASVSSFLDKLRSVNPTMADQFEQTLEELLSEEMPPEGQQMGMNPPQFADAAPAMDPSQMNEAGPARGIPSSPPASPPGAPTSLPNETVPENIRGPIQG